MTSISFQADVPNDGEGRLTDCLDAQAKSISYSAMLAGRHRPPFTQAVMTELGSFPQKGLICLGGWAFVSAAGDMIAWPHHPNFLVADYMLATAQIIGLATISFYSVTRMVGTPMTWRGAFGFFGTGVALFVPILLALGLVVLAANLKVKWGVVVAALMMLASLLPISLLPGWPIWQTASVKLIGPMEAFRATKGNRFALLAASFVASAINRAMPETSSASDFLTACALAAGNGLFGCITTILGLSIAVAAYRRMCAASVQG